MTDPIKNNYDEWHKNLATLEEPGNVLSKVWYQKAILNLPNLNGKKVLEIGCGRGEFSNHLNRMYPSAIITSTDFSNGAIEVARSKYSEGKNLEFKVEDAQALSFKDNSFDVIVCCETLEHIPDVSKAVSEIYRVLTKGGGYFISTPSYFNAYALVWLKCWLLNKPFESGQGVQPFEHFYTFIFVKKILSRAGLKLETHFSTHFQWFVFPRVDPAKLRTIEFKCSQLNSIFKPFGVHFFYKGHK